MKVRLLHHAANTQDGIYPRVKRQKHTPVTHHLQRRVYLLPSTGGPCVGETARNLEFRVNEHQDVKEQSEPAKHIRKHPNHKFTWQVLTTSHSWLKSRIKEVFHIARFRPELNKQVQSLDLTLFSMGTGITYLVLPQLYKNTETVCRFSRSDS